MKHNSKGRKLNRFKKHRQSLITNLALGLFEHGHIKTTLAKAKSTSRMVDKLITTAKKDTIPAKRRLAKIFGKRQPANQLANNIAKELKARHSGYTRIVRLGSRQGDDAMMVRLELIDHQPTQPTEKKIKKSATKPPKTTTKKDVTKKKTATKKEK